MKIEKQKNLFKAIITMIVIIGAIMVYSSSYIFSSELTGNSYHFITKQLVFIVIGSLVAIVFSITKFKFWYNRSYLWNAMASFLLLLTYIPGLSLNIKGASRWINLGGFSLQPSEFVKVTIILASIKFFEEFNAKTAKENLKLALNLFVPLLLLLLQPDFGSVAIITATIMYVCFLSSFPRKYFYMTLAAAAISLVGVLVAAPYRVRRLLTYLDPWSDPHNSGFQIIQSYLAFANGSITGQGLGNSQEKLFYLPEAYNDFIFSVIGEELGFIGVAFIAFAFLALAFTGFKLAVNVTSRKATMFISTVVFAICLQAYLNMGVVLGLLPTKGLNLPLISYGGSSMISNLAAIGLIFSAIKFAQSMNQEDASSQVRESFRSNSYQNYSYRS